MTRTVSLGDICIKVTSGGTPSTKHDEYYGGDIPWLRTQEVNFGYIYSTEKTITEAGLKNSSAKLIPKNSVIIAMYGATAGKSAVNKIPLTTNQACCNLIIDNTKADYRYVYYYLLNGYEKLLASATGAAQQNLGAKQIAGMPIELPDIEMQKKISDILGTIDEKIELSRKMNETLEQMGQALFRYYFIDNPEAGDWERGVLTDIINLNPREPIPKSSPTTYLEMKNMPEVGMSVKATETREFTSGMKFRNRDTLLARITPCLENGKTAYVDFLDDDEVGFGSTEYIVMRPKEDAMTEYTYFLARSDVFRVYAIQSMVGTSGRQRVQNDSIAAYEVAIPEENLLAEFHGEMQGVFAQVRNNARQIQSLTTLRDTLLPRLISGKVKV